MLQRRGNGTQVVAVVPQALVWSPGNDFQSRTQACRRDADHDLVFGEAARRNRGVEKVGGERMHGSVWSR
eukprot:2987005-Prymnesium_polylepis.1